MPKNIVDCEEADLNNSSQTAAIITILDSYASDIMGGCEPLSQFCKDNLIFELKRLPTAHVFLAKVDHQYAGLAICYESFSTFACRRLLNIHDLCVLPKYRRKGIGGTLLMYLTDYCRSHGLCKLTLEVVGCNQGAKALYLQSGFSSELDEDSGSVEFWQKDIL